MQDLSIYIGLHLALKIVAKESLKHFLSNIWRKFIFLVLLNPRNTRACFKQQYPRVLSKYSVVATIWLHRKKRKFIKNYDTRRYKEYSFSSLSANKGVNQRVT